MAIAVTLRDLGGDRPDSGDPARRDPAQIGGGEVSLRLESWLVPGTVSRGHEACGWSTPGRTEIEARFELTFTTVVQLDPAALAMLVRRTSGCHVVAPPPGTTLAAGKHVGARDHVPVPAGPRQRRPGERLPDRAPTARSAQCAPAGPGDCRWSGRGADLPSAELSSAWAAVAEARASAAPGRCPVLSPTGEHRAPPTSTRRSGRSPSSVPPTWRPAPHAALQRDQRARSCGRAPCKTRQRPRHRVAGCTSTSPGSSSRHQRRLADRHCRVARTQPVAPTPDRR